MQNITAAPRKPFFASVKSIAFLTLAVALTFFALHAPSSVGADPATSKDFVIYGVQNGLNMGEPGEVARKDFFINMGTKHGLKNGSVLMVHRKAPSLDQINKKLHQDVTFPIATVRIIHVEETASIARLEKLNPPDKTAVIVPNMVMVGDLVQP